ncbi:MAG: DUF4145 domain-containing protein [Phycisphaerae bacterium]|nr:DUF4145 domain-containing protein [Phycisphaerae bacterium]
MLDNLSEFIQFLRSNAKELGARVRTHRSSPNERQDPVVAGELFCATCGDSRRYSVEPNCADVAHRLYKVASIEEGFSVGPIGLSGPSREERELRAAHTADPVRSSADILAPSIFNLSCVQCQSRLIAVIYRGPDGPALAMLSEHHGGLRTAHTPPAVAYYLDQAHRSHSVGANSAAIAMYRGALEQLLFDQGYKNGMLGKKLSDLSDARKAGAAPKWAMELEDEFLALIKDLGNGSIHPNDGDVAKQSILDSECIADVAETFMHLLYIVYEIPHQRDKRLTSLQLKAKALKK